MTELYANATAFAVPILLTVGVDADDTVFAVSATAPVALRGGTSVWRIGSELVTMTIPGDGLSPWSGARGAEGSVAAAHVRGSVAKNVLSAATVNDVVNVRLPAVESSRGADLGVGDDLILLLGQSNMSGRGTGPDTAKLDVTNPRVWQYGVAGTYPGQFSLASEPLLMHDTPTAMGPGLVFARDYAQSVAVNRRVVLVGCAHGGTGFDSGNPTWRVTDVGESYANTITQATAALAASGQNARIAAALWIQGETDASDDMIGPDYEAALDELIEALREDLDSPEMLFVLGQMAPDGAATLGGTWDDINAVHIDTPARLERTGFAYGPAGPSGESSAFHYSAAQQRVLGRSMFRALERAEVNVLGTPPPVPTGLAVTQSGTTLTATVDQPEGRVTDLHFRYRIQGAGSWTTLSRAQSIDITAAITGITKGSTYEIQAQTENEQGLGGWSATETIATVDNPGQVTGLAAVAGAPSASVIALTWNTVAGAAAYLVEYKAAASPTWLTSQTVTAAAATVMGLTANTSYDFRVTATNAAGAGTPSATETISTQPINFLLSDVGATPWRAYGLRQLRSDYAGAAIRVRRSSDDAEMDVGFVTRDLDTAAMLAWSGADSVFVTKIYNQAGSGPDITQATAAKQPRIANAGALDTANGKPCMVFDGTNDIFTDATPGLFAAGAMTILAVLATSADNARRLVAEASSSSNNTQYEPWTVRSNGRPSAHVRDSVGTDFLSEVSLGGTATPADNMLRQWSVSDPGTQITFVADQGAAMSTAVFVRPGANMTLSTFAIGGLNRAAGESLWLNGKVSEILCFTSALSAPDKAAGAANEKSYWGTP